ncbi:DNA-directed RNA polymerase subunit omega [candidate division WOR-3 bacterium]|nr:DNA-directed RNA polymerase subunit omega [candidate division WOR-3 bacterium]
MDNKNFRIAKDELLENESNLYEITIAAAREAKRINIIAKNRAVQLEEKPLVTAFKKLKKGELNFFYLEEEETEEKQEKTEKKN